MSFIPNHRNFIFFFSSIFPPHLSYCVSFSDTIEAKDIEVHLEIRLGLATKPR